MSKTSHKCLYFTLEDFQNIRYFWKFLHLISNLWQSKFYFQARIIAEKGSIVIGNDNLIEETAVIKNTNDETLYIGNENIFEVQSEFIGEFFL